MHCARNDSKSYGAKPDNHCCANFKLSMIGKTFPLSSYQRSAESTWIRAKKEDQKCWFTIAESDPKDGWQKCLTQAWLSRSPSHDFYEWFYVVVESDFNVQKKHNYAKTRNTDENEKFLGGSKSFILPAVSGGAWQTIWGSCSKSWLSSNLIFTRKYLSDSNIWKCRAYDSAKSFCFAWEQCSGPRSEVFTERSSRENLSCRIQKAVFSRTCSACGRTQTLAWPQSLKFTVIATKGFLAVVVTAGNNSLNVLNYILCYLFDYLKDCDIQFAFDANF